MKTVTIYIDILLFVNLIVNGTVIFASSKIVGAQIPFTRFAAADAAASIYGFFVCLPQFGFMLSIIGKTVFAILLSATAFGVESWRKLIKNACFLMFCFMVYLAVIIGISQIPICYGMFYIKNNEIYYDMPVSTVLLAGLTVLAITVIYGKIKSKKKAIKLESVCEVTVNGITESYSLLCDSGNLLKDCITGKPVVIIGKNNTKSITEHGIPKTRIRLIPYKTADGRNGIINAFKPDKAYIDGEKSEILIAISDAEFDGHDGIIGINQ